MGKSVDNKVKAEALTDMDIDVCDDCGSEFSKDDLRDCRKCGVILCDFCSDLHECDDEYSAKPKPPKKVVDKHRKM